MLALLEFRCFLQAEDGIRDMGVTGVQTCALPILVPDITGGTGTESDETPGWWWPVGLSQSEGAHERGVSVDGALFRVPGPLGGGRPSIYTTALLAGNPSQLPRWQLPGRFGGANRGGAVSRPGAHENRSPACATRGGANPGEVR